jgi:hypothetical protein
MSAKTKLRNALDAIDNARRALKRAKHNVPDDGDIRKAIREIDEAEEEIERAIRDLSD